MATQEMDDFLEDELISQYVTFPPEVVAALEQVHQDFSEWRHFYVQLKLCT